MKAPVFYIIEAEKQDVEHLIPGGLYAIPAGQYQVQYTRSERFSILAGQDIWLPVVLDLPVCATPTLFHGKPIDDCGIRIHGGNVVNSILWGQPGGPASPVYNVNDPNRTDSEGCLLVGIAFGSDDKSLLESQAALRPLVTKIANACDNGVSITLTISETTA